MKIGLLRVDLLIPMCTSLKKKRSILKRQIHRLRTHYNVGVSEIGRNDAWKNAQLGIVTINTRSHYIERAFKAILQELDQNGDIEVVETSIELL